MSRKYQIFISSTYKDLKKERQQAVQIILRAGHIPAGMELFGQDDRNQWEVIKDWIDNSDIFVIMVKNRYGTICKDTGLSYTQMEYEYAREKKKPIIKIVFSENTDAEKCDNTKELKAFRNMILKDCVAGPISSEAEMTQRISDKINEYTRNLKGGWYKYDEMQESYYKTRYKLMQFLMFDEDDRDRAGHNRFNVLPKILMLQDMKREYNPVSIDDIEIKYTIDVNKESGTTNLYDCKRQWTMHNMKNLSNQKLDRYTLYTATDIGNRNNERGKIENCVSCNELVLSDESYKNNGISCWKWRITPGIGHNELIRNMILKEEVNNAWNLNRKQEIIYFIPKCFGHEIGILNIVIKANAEVPVLQMEMFEIDNINIQRISRGILKRERNNDTGERIYGISITDGVDMERVYYIVIRKLEL